MKMFKNGIALAGFALILATGGASATEMLTLNTDQSRIMKIDRSIGTVVVGNPSIADVTVQDNHVFFHGRAFGTTNIVILDEQGQPIGDYEVTVQTGGSNNVAVYKGPNYYPVVCAPLCEATIHVGMHDMVRFQDLVKQIGSKKKLATGETDSEAEEPKPTE